MMQAVIEAAVRSLVLALMVYAGLRIFRVRNVRAEKIAWTVVLAAAILLPALLPVAAWLPLPAAKVALSLPQSWTNTESTAPRTADVSPAASVAIAEQNSVQPAGNSAAVAADRFPDPTVSFSEPGAAPVESLPVRAQRDREWTPAELAALLYFAIAAGLLLRLVLGLVAAARLWSRAQPVNEAAAAVAGPVKLRWTSEVASPVTIGHGILLPADYAEWNDEKLRVVIAHERSHIRQGDFYLQTLARLYAALVWLSPLGWWLQRKLSDLSEAIGDREGLEEAASCSLYAQILLEFAAAPRPTTIGVAMARSSNLSERIERLLNESAFRQAFAGGRRMIAAAVLIPAMLFAAAALVRVEAAIQTPQSNQPAPAAQAAPDSQRHIDIPPVHVNVPAIHVNVPAQHIEVPAVHVNVPATHVDVPATHVDVPAQHIDVPAQHIDVPAIHIDVPRAGAQDGSGGHAAYASTGVLYAMLGGLGHLFIQPASPAVAEATFDRTLTFSGKLDLHVANGSGNIHLTRGPAGQVRVHGRVHSSSAEDAEQVKEIAANPPIVQNGSAIQIGTQHREGTNHISIDYEIEAPADASLAAMSGSGNIADEGVGQGAKLMTGSGNITATGLEGGFKIETGSGNIKASNSGDGDAKAEAGSGNIKIDGVHGALKAATGSGHIQVTGTPSAAWKLEAGSGTIDLNTGNAPMTIDAEAGSGTITTDRPMEQQTSGDRHHVRGQLNGGGPEVKLETGSGEIHVH